MLQTIIENLPIGKQKLSSRKVNHLTFDDGVNFLWSHYASVAKAKESSPHSGMIRILKDAHYAKFRVYVFKEGDWHLSNLFSLVKLTSRGTISLLWEELKVHSLSR